MTTEKPVNLPIETDEHLRKQLRGRQLLCSARSDYLPDGAVGEAWLLLVQDALLLHHLNIGRIPRKEESDDRGDLVHILEGDPDVIDSHDSQPFFPFRRFLNLAEPHPHHL